MDSPVPESEILNIFMETSKLHPRGKTTNIKIAITTHTIGNLRPMLLQFTTLPVSFLPSV